MATRAEQEAAYQAWLATNPQLQSEEYGPTETGDNESHIYTPGGTRYYFDYNGQKLNWDGNSFRFAPTDDYILDTGESQYTTGMGTYNRDTGFGAIDWKKAERPEAGGWISNNQALFAGIVLAAMGGAYMLTGAESAALADAGLSSADEGLMGFSGSTTSSTGLDYGVSTLAGSQGGPEAGYYGVEGFDYTVPATSPPTTSPNVSVPTDIPYSNEGRNYPTPESTQGNGGSPVNSPSGTPSIDLSNDWSLDRIINAMTNGGLTMSDAARLLTGLYGANRQQQYADNLMNLYKPYNDQASWYGQKLRETYENPATYFSGPEWQGIQATTGDYLQRNDAAGGRLANDIQRQATLQNLASQQISNYRSGLSDTYRNLAGIGTGQGMQTAYAANRDAYGGLVGTVGNIMSKTDPYQQSKQINSLGDIYRG